MPETMKMRCQLGVLCWGVALLVILCVGLAWVCRPWMDTLPANEAVGLKAMRTIEVSGAANMAVKPDQFVFSPRFEQVGTDPSQITAVLNKQVAEIVKALEVRGVLQDDISVDRRIDRDYSSPDASSAVQVWRGLAVVTLQTTDEALALKVNQYLSTSALTGQLSTTTQLSDALQKQVESELRVRALLDAKRKAEESTAALGVALGAVMTIRDGASSTAPMMYGARKSLDANETLYAGKKDLDYTVTVTFELH